MNLDSECSFYTSLKITLSNITKLWASQKAKEMHSLPQTKLKENSEV